MMRLIPAAFVVAALASFGSVKAETKANASAQALLKTWAGAICNGKITVTFSFSEIRGGKLIGSAKDSTGGTSTFSHDGTSSGTATWDGSTVVIETAATLSSLKPVSGKLVGTYSRKPGYYNPSNRMGCPQQEAVTYQ